MKRSVKPSRLRVALATGGQLKALAAALLAAHAPSVLSQQEVTPTGLRRAGDSISVGPFDTTGSTGSTGEGARRSFEVVPRVSYSVSALHSERDALPGVVPLADDVVQQLSVGFGVQANSARLRGLFDYAAQAFRYSKLNEANRVTQSIRGQGRATVIDDRLVIDMGISRAESGQSAFAAPVQVASLANANRVEVTNAFIAPTLNATVLNAVDVQARYTHAVSDSTRAAFVPLGTIVPGSVGRLTSDSVEFSLSGGARLGWQVSAQDTMRRYTLGRDIETRSLDATFNYALDVDLAVRAGFGVEENSVLSPAFQATNTRLLGVRWTPTPRTLADAEVSERFFGNGHRFSLQHRMAGTLIRISDARQLSAQLSGAFGVPGTSVSLLEELLRGNTLRGTGTAAEREKAIVDGLLAAGIDPAQTVQPNSLNATPSTNRRQELFIGYSGPRVSVSVTGFTNQLQRLGNPLNPFEDLALTPQVRQSGISGSLGYRLNPTSSISANTQAASTPSRGVLPGNEVKSSGLTYGTTVGRHMAVLLTAQQVQQTTQSATARIERKTQIVGATFNLRF